MDQDSTINNAIDQTRKAEFNALLVGWISYFNYYLKKCITQFYKEGKSVQEIATILGTHPNYVYQNFNKKDLIKEDSK